MKFKQVVFCDVGSQLIALIIAIFAALAGWGVWALVAQTITNAGVVLLFRVIASKWKPTRFRRGDSLRRDLRDGAGFGLASILQYAVNNADTAVIAVNWDAASVGLYDRAFRLLRVPASNLTAPLRQVVIPVLNREKAAGRDPNIVLLRLQRLIGFVVVWVFAATAAIATWLIPTVLGGEWVEAVPLFQILAIGGAVQIFSAISFWQFISSNLGKQMFIYTIISKTFAIALIVVGSFFSLHAVALMASIGLVVSWPLNLLWLSKYQPSWRFFKNGAHLLASGAAAFVVGYFINPILQVRFGAMIAAILTTVLVTIVYLLGVMVWPAAGKDLIKSVTLIRSLLPRPSANKPVI